jgi:hypothetical protein
MSRSSSKIRQDGSWLANIHRRSSLS